MRNGVATLARRPELRPNDFAAHPLSRVQAGYPIGKFGNGTLRDVSSPARNGRGPRRSAWVVPKGSVSARRVPFP